MLDIQGREWLHCIHGGVIWGGGWVIQRRLWLRANDILFDGTKRDQS